MSRCVIISACPVSASLSSTLRPGDTIIACDAGYRNCAPLHSLPLVRICGTSSICRPPIMEVIIT